MKNLLGEIQRDLRFAVRSLMRAEKFTLLAVFALALGIGSVTVIFSAIYGVVIDTSPCPHFDSMVSFPIEPIGRAAGSGRAASVTAPAPSRAAQYVRMSTEHQQYSPENTEYGDCPGLFGSLHEQN